MSRPVIPIHVKNLINELAPVVAPGAKDMDVIFAGLLSLKEKYYLSNNSEINNRNHSFYSTATPEEEKNLEKSFTDLKNKNYKIIKPEDNILEILDAE